MQALFRTSRRAAVVLGLCIETACFPAIVHTPDVAAGTHLTLAGALVAASMLREDDSLRRSTVFLPVGIVRASYGIRSRQTSGGAALELGGEFVFPQGLVGDLYLQAPKQWTGRTDLGIGVAPVIMSARGPMVYGQFGTTIGDNVYVFTTQAVGRFTHASGPSRDNPAFVWWQPSVAVQPNRSAELIRYFFVSATIGGAVGRCAPVEFLFECSRPPASLVAIGAAVSPPLPVRRRR